MVVADNSNATHVAPYPGFVPVTFVIIFFVGGVVYLSVGSLNDSSFVQPSPWNVIENCVLRIVSSVGPSWENIPNENIFGNYNSNSNQNQVHRLLHLYPYVRLIIICDQTKNELIRQKWHQQKILQKCEARLCNKFIIILFISGIHAHLSQITEMKRKHAFEWDVSYLHRKNAVVIA